MTTTTSPAERTSCSVPAVNSSNHAIVRAPTIQDRPGRSFMKHYVFPDHFLATIGRAISGAGTFVVNFFRCALLAKPFGLKTLDVQTVDAS